MAEGTASSALHALQATLVAIWRFGSVALVGWTPTSSGVELLVAPMTRLFEHIHRHRRLLVGGRLMGRRTFNEVAEQLGVQPIEIRLDAAIGDTPGAIALRDLESAMTPFSIQHTDQRAVFLVDIAGFSLLVPEQQALQVTTLEFALNLASAAIADRERGSRFLRSTTGDGFYVWSAEKGLAADLSLLAVLVVALTVLGFLRRSPAAASAPVLRSCFGIGSHYTYRQPKPDGTADSDFIVGQVTIELARLISAAKADQILVGDFCRRASETSGSLDAVAFLAQASERMDWLRGLALPSSRIERLALYLTGPPDGEGGFQVHALDVIDKHGISHRCFNMKVNVFLDDGDPFYCGLRHDERANLAR